MYDIVESTGWQNPIGCLKLQVILRKRATNYRALLQKMTTKDKATYDSCLYAVDAVESTGWQKPIGCLKLQVILRKRATNYRALLRNMMMKDKAPYESSPLCVTCT